MNFINQCVQLLFPSVYSQKNLDQIPMAPIPTQKYISALYDYQKPQGKKLIYSIKQKRDRFLESLLAQKMKNHLLDELSEQGIYSYFLEPIIIPVPLHNKRKQERGFNQSAGIAKELARILPGDYKNLLIKNKQTQKQALISQKSERITNIQNCFALNTKYNEYIRNKDVIVVDDLTTTGATLNECKKVLLKKGARNVLAITVAH